MPIKLLTIQLMNYFWPFKYQPSLLLRSPLYLGDFVSKWQPVSLSEYWTFQCRSGPWSEIRTQSLVGGCFWYSGVISIQIISVDKIVKWLFEGMEISPSWPSVLTFVAAIVSICPSTRRRNFSMSMFLEARYSSRGRLLSPACKTSWILYSGDLKTGHVRI